MKKLVVALSCVGLLCSPLVPNVSSTSVVSYDNVSAMTHTQEVRVTNVDYGRAMWVSAVKYVPSLDRRVMCSGYIYKIRTRFDFSKGKWEYTYSGELRPGPIAAPYSLPESSEK